MSRRRTKRLIPAPVGPMLAGLCVVIFGCSGSPPESIEVPIPGLEEPMYFIAGAELMASLDDESGADAAAELKKGLNLAKADEYQAALPIFVSLAQAHPRATLFNNLGVLQAAGGNSGAAREAFLQAIGLDGENQIILMNHGLLKLSGGQVDDAVKTLETVEFQPAKRAIRRLRQRIEAGTLEVEPNNDPSQPNDAALDTWIDGTIASRSDRDAFKFTTPAKSRDWLRIEVENLSDTLKPRIGVYHESEQTLGGSTQYDYKVTPGQDMSYSYVCAPDTTYFVVVLGVGGTGAYRMRIAPQRAYDAYEPNGERLQAADASIGDRLEAGIMDGGDTDFYKIRTSAGTTTVKLELANRSNSLKPRLVAYLANKQVLGGTTEYGYKVTPGQDMKLSFAAQGEAEYYVQVATLGGTGEYALAITEE